MQAQEHDAAPQTPVPVARAVMAGVLMGMANLVPGISGGTMLVACGVYRRFIDAVSDFSRLRPSKQAGLLLALIVAGAASAIAGCAGLIHWALVEHRWVMYSLFIGLTLGGAPILWRMARPLRADVMAGLVVGAAVMGLMVYLQETGAGGAGLSGPGWLLFGGIAGASAMILPGISGAFLLLLLGQYETIIGSVKSAVAALSRADLGALMAEMWVIVPVGIGVLLGIAAVSNVLKWVMHRYERPTIGVLLGLLVAAPAGLYPFREGVPPAVGDTIKGRLVTEDNVEEFRSPDQSKDWAQRAYRPDPGEIAACLGLIGVGFGATVLISRLGRDRPA